MLTELELAKLKSEVVPCFPQVLSGELPLRIFADMILDEGLHHEAEWIARSQVKGVSPLLGWRLGLTDQRGWYALTKPNPPISSSSGMEIPQYYWFDTEAEANQACRIIAIVNVGFAILAGMSIQERVIPSFDSEMAKRELKGLPLPIIHKDFTFTARQLEESRVTNERPQRT